MPAVFTPRFRDELLALRGDRGARVVRDETHVIPCAAAAVDIDTEEDLLTL